jgi:hypothetical protein
MVKVSCLEEFVPVLLVGVVWDNDNIKAVLPLGIESLNLGPSSGATDGSSYFVARSYKCFNDMGGHKGVGSGYKCGGHCTVILVKQEINVASGTQSGGKG